MDNSIIVNNKGYDMIDVLPYTSHDILVYVSENDSAAFTIGDTIEVTGNYVFTGTVTAVLIITGMDKSMIKANGRFFACER